VFEYRDPWALLSLLRIHSHTPAAGNSAFSTLALSVPLAPNPEAAPGGPAGLDQAIVYVRLRLTALTSMPGEPVRRTLVPAPRFPAAAPDISSMLTAFPAAVAPERLIPAPAAGP
jgi:hypothetical protein